jgi:hypothetical protein
MGHKDSHQHNHEHESDTEDTNHHNKYSLKEVKWGILKGEKGKRGKRGKRGERGKHGRSGKHGYDAVLSFGSAVNDTVGEFTSNIGDAIEWPNNFFPYLDVVISSNIVNLVHNGVYQFDYSLRGLIANTATTFAMGLLYNGNIINGSKFAITPSSNLQFDNVQVLNGTVIAEIDQPNANVQLLNLSDDTVKYTNNDMSNNASINVIRLV